MLSATSVVQPLKLFEPPLKLKFDYFTDAKGKLRAAVRATEKPQAKNLCAAPSSHCIARNRRSSEMVAKLVAESLIAYGMTSSRRCSNAPQV